MNFYYSQQRRVGLRRYTMGSGGSRPSSPPRQPASSTELHTYDFLAAEMEKDEFLAGPSQLHMKIIEGCQLGDLEPKDRMPMLARARDRKAWFKCLIPKCDPGVVWSEGGQEVSLGVYLYGHPTYSIWLPYMNKWEEDHKNITVNVSPTSPGYHDERWSEFRPVAAALGIAVATSVATSSLGVGLAAFPAMAVGHVIWKVIRKWYGCFDNEIKPNHQRLRIAFGNLAKSVGKTVMELNKKIEGAQTRLRADPEVASADIGKLRLRVELLQAVLSHEVSRVEGTPSSDENEMMERIQELFEFQRRLQNDLERERVAEDLRSVVATLGRMEELLGQVLRSQSPVGDPGAPDGSTPTPTPRVSAAGSEAAPSSHSSAITGGRRSPYGFFDRDFAVQPSTGPRRGRDVIGDKGGYENG